MLATKTTDIRSTNKRRVAVYLLHHPGTTQQAIQRDLRLSKQTVLTILGLLDKEGILRRGEMLDSTGGRPPVSLSLRGDAGYFVGMRIIGNVLSLVVIDLAAVIAARKRIPLGDTYRVGFLPELDPGFTSAELVEERLPGILDVFIREASIPRERIMGIGIEVPASQMDKVSAQQMESALGFPVWIERPEILIGTAESWLHQIENAVCLMLEHTVGGVVIIGGRIYNGITGHANSISHMILHPDGKACPCGRRGCFGLYCTSPVSEAYPSLKSFFAAVEAGVPAANARLEEYMSELALGICTLAAIWDQPFILSGEVSVWMEPYLPHLRQLIAQQGGEFSAVVSLGQYGAEAAEIGAALLWHRKYFRELL